MIDSQFLSSFNMFCDDSNLLSALDVLGHWRRKTGLVSSRKHHVGFSYYCYACSVIMERLTDLVIVTKGGRV